MQLVVCALNWEALGHPPKAPPHARIGAPTSQSQQRTLDLLEAQIDYLLRVPSFVPDSLGRSAEKLSSFARVIEELPSENFGMQDLLGWASNLHASLLPYDAPRPRPPTVASRGFSPKTYSSDAELANQAEDTQAARQFIDFRTGGPLPMVAERVKWKCAPSFNPKPYLSPFLNLAYEQPDVLRRPSDQWPRMAPAKLHCSREEHLRLGRKLDEFGAVRVFNASLVDWPEAVGLFCVSKSATHDRLIINPTVCNSRSYTVSRYSKTLAPGSLLCLLHLGPTVAFRYSADDLSDYYYCYRISNARALRNSFRCRFDPSEVMDFRDAQARDLVGPQVLALNTLAMGDNLAVEVGQAAHFQVLRQHACALHPDQTLLYRHVVPQGDTVEMLSIDDHICLQKVPLVDIAQKPQRRDTIIFDKATTAYKLVGLNLNDDKKRRNLTKGVLLGAEIDGVLGVVGPPRDRTLCLALLTTLVAKRGHCTRELLERLLGSWIHAVMFRRPVFAVLDQLFREGLGKPRNLVFKLSDQAKNELLMLSCLASTLLTDLRASYDPRLYCLDASPQGGAVCAAQVGSSASEQFWRHGELRGYHTRLQSEVSALLSGKGIAHASQDLFGATTGPPPELLNQPSLDPLVPRPLHEGILYDAVVLGSTSDAWGQALQGFGLKVLFKGSSARASHGERLDFGSGLFHELASLAARRVVREWHWSGLFSTFGTLRKPRRRSALCPLVYAITAVQDRFPQHRNFLTSAWQIDKKWQRAEPGECRPVLPAACIRAAVSLGLLWGWFRWTAALIIGFLAMLHPGELVALTRKDLVFPADTLDHSTNLFVHLRDPKTSRFARRQHGRIDDEWAIKFLYSLAHGLRLDEKLYPGSLHSFRRQWDAVLSWLGLPTRAAVKGATPGVLRGSGATHFYLCTENIPLLAVGPARRRWSNIYRKWQRKLCCPNCLPRFALAFGSLIVQLMICSFISPAADCPPGLRFASLTVVLRRNIGVERRL